MTMISDAQHWRHWFPTLARKNDGQEIIYLDSAASSLKPRAVTDALSSYYLTNGANIHRGAHALAEEVSTQFERVRRRMAVYLGCFGDEVVFVKNTTEALNLVARGLSIDPVKDWALMPLDAHHSLMLPWRRRCTTRFIRVDAQGRVDLDDYRNHLKEGPRVVALSHCSNVTGVYQPLATMVEMAKAVGAWVVVDAAQSIPHRRMDLGKLGADFVAFSGHKMLGPTGVGVLAGRKEALELLSPLMLGGGTVDWVDAQRFDLRKVPHRFEAGTPDIAAVLGMGAALTLLESIEPQALENHDRALAQRLVEGARARDYLQVLGPVDDSTDRAAILSVSFQNRDSLTDIARMLGDGYGVMCRSGHLCAQPFVDTYRTGEVLRASGYLYNAVVDVDRFFEALDEVRASLGL